MSKDAIATEAETAEILTLPVRRRVARRDSRFKIQQFTNRTWRTSFAANSASNLQRDFHRNRRTHSDITDHEAGLQFRLESFSKITTEAQEMRKAHIITMRPSVLFMNESKEIKICSR